MFGRVLCRSAVGRCDPRTSLGASKLSPSTRSSVLAMRGDLGPGCESCRSLRHIHEYIHGTAPWFSTEGTYPPSRRHGTPSTIACALTTQNSFPPRPSARRGLWDAVRRRNNVCSLIFAIIPKNSVRRRRSEAHRSTRIIAAEHGTLWQRMV